LLKIRRRGKGREKEPSRIYRGGEGEGEDGNVLGRRKKKKAKDGKGMRERKVLEVLPLPRKGELRVQPAAGSLFIYPRGGRDQVKGRK